MNPSSIIGLVNNAALLLALGLLYGMLGARPWGGKPTAWQFITGVILGAAGIAVMLNPWEFKPGVVFDTRSVLLSISGLFFGTVPMLLAVLMTGAFRLYMGGAGAWTGVAVIVTSGGIGLAWRHLRRNRAEYPSLRELYLLGLVVHVAMLLWMLSLGWPVALDVLSKISLPVMLIYPVATALLGWLMVNRGAHKRAEEKIEHLNLVLRAIRNVNQLIVKEKDRDRLVQRACDLLIETRGYYNAWIALLDETGRLVTAVEAGLGKDFLPMAERLERGELADCGQRAMMQSDAVVVKDPVSTCTDCPLSDKYGGRGAMTIRLEHGEEVYGLMSLSVPGDLAADEEEKHLLAEIAGDIAFALHNIEMEEAHKRMEENLKGSEERFQTLFTASKDAMIAINSKGLIELYNPAAEKMFGHRIENMIGQQVDGLMPDTLRTKHRKDVANYFATGKPDGVIGKTVEVSAVRSNGEEFPVEISLASGGAKDKQFVLGVIRDITERKRAEEALRESEERFRQIYERMAVGVARISLEFRIEAANEAYCRMLGYREEELIGKHLRDITHPESLEENLRKQSQLVAGEIDHYRLEKRFVHKSGRVIQGILNANFVRDAEGQPLYFLGSVLDITERKLAEERVRFLSSAVEQSSEGMAVADMEGNLMHVNQAWVEMHGYESPEELAGRHLSIFHAPEQLKNEVESFNEMVMENGYHKGEVGHIRKDGTPFPTIMTTTLLKDESGKPIAFSGIASDITEHKRAEASLKESESRYRAMFENMGDGVAVYQVVNDGEDFTFLDFNRASEKIDHIKKEELIGQSVLKVFPSVKEFGLFEVFQRVWSTGNPEDHAVSQYKDERLQGWRDNFVYKLPSGEVVAIYRDETRRRQAEEALGAERDNLRNIFESIQDGIYISNQQYDLQYVNEVIVRDFGPYEGRKCYEYLHDRDEVCPWCKNEDVWAGKTVRWDWYSSKNRKTYSLVDTPMTLPDGSIGKLEIFHDITDRKQAEEALRENEKRYRTIVQTAMDGFWLTDTKGNFLEVNAAYSQMSGYSIEELRNTNISDVEASESPEEVARHIQKGIETGWERFETVHRRKDKSTFDVEVNFQYLAAIEGGRFVSFLRDITERKRAGEALRESEEKHRDLYENAPNAYVSISVADGSILNCNKTASLILGYDKESLLKMKAFDLSADTPDGLSKAKEVFKGFREGEPVHDVELQVKHKDGHTFWVSLSLEPVKDYEGNIIKSRVMAIDISERKNLESQFQQAQKMESVGILAGGIAHDFNNLLMAINGYTELLLMKKQEGEPDHQILKAIRKAGERAAQLVRKLLTFSRKVEPERRSIDINRQVKQVGKLLKMTIPKMIKIEFHLADDLRTVNADPGQIEQILMNLGTNARDAMPEGGRLVIETENVTLDEEYCRAHLGANPGDYILLTVSDTGHGMDKETVEHIFDPFFTTKEIGKGTGLGLASVYGLVKIHGGYIMCYSEAGRGTTFKIYLPAIEQKAKPSTPGPMAAPLTGGTGTILVVDDEESIRDLVSRMLERFGYKVILASSGENALEVYSERNDQIDLVILDIGMPGMGGHKCLKELLKLDRNIKVIIASGYSLNGQMEETLESGAAGFVGKPYRLANLLKIVQQVLDKEDR